MSILKILLVDDSKSARYALRLMLKKHDYDVDMAESAEIALEKVKEQRPDAIFMDHLMPGMNGFEALDTLKSNAETTHIPVVMCTSNDDEPYQIMARKKGALGILPKPATPEKLNTMLAAIEASVGQPTEAAETALAAPPAPASALDETAIAALVSAQIGQLMEEQVKPLLGDSLDSRLEKMRSRLFENVMERSAAQMAQWMDAEMAEIREQLPKPADTQDLAAKLDSEFRLLKSELVKMETEHAQAVVYKISNEVMPELIAKQLDKLEQRINERIDLRIGELSKRMVQELPANDQLIRQLSETAETIAGHKAEEIASARAQEIAESAAAEQTEEVSEFLLDSKQSSTRLMYILAGGAAGVGVLSSIVMYLLV